MGCSCLLGEVRCEEQLLVPLDSSRFCVLYFFRIAAECRVSAALSFSFRFSRLLRRRFGRHQIDSSFPLLRFFAEPCFGVDLFVLFCLVCTGPVDCDLLATSVEVGVVARARSTTQSDVLRTCGGHSCFPSRNSRRS